jgi:hypothetical protein
MASKEQEARIIKNTFNELWNEISVVFNNDSLDQTRNKLHDIGERLRFLRQKHDAFNNKYNMHHENIL